MFGAIPDHSNPIENSRFEREFAIFRKGVAKRLPKKPSDPKDVAALVYHAATDPRKKPLYKINNNPTLSLLGLLPTRWLDKLLAVPAPRKKP